MMAQRSESISLLLSSSALTAVLVYWWTSNLEGSSNSASSDDFVAGQGKPALDNDDPYPHVSFIHQRLSLQQIRRRSQRLLQNCQQRRTLRFFSADPVPKDVIETILKTACTAPSGAHKQPRTFVAVQNRQIKQTIRELVEKEESTNYQSRMRKSWVDDLQPMMKGLHHDINTSTGSNQSASATTDTVNIQKPYLTEAPWLIAVFKQTHGGIDPQTGKRIDHYYVQESVGIACGMLCVAIQNANLVTLTSTPMGAEKAIRELLKRPDNEKLFLLLPVGFPAKDATVPYRNPERKPSSETIVWA